MKSTSTSKKKSFLAGAALLALVSCGNDDNNNNDPGAVTTTPPPPQQQEERTVNFTVTIENVSRPGLIKTPLAQGTVPLSPGVFAIFNGDENPAFTPGQRADLGTERIAEDGFIEPPMGLETTLLTSAKSSGTFIGRGGIPDSPEITSGEIASFNFSAVRGDRLTFETMFVQSNDWFYGDDGKGISLFDSAGNPISGNITSKVYLWDAGTEVDEKPGIGMNQKLRQAPDATDVGPAENMVITKVGSRYRGWKIPKNSKVLKVIITPN